MDHKFNFDEYLDGSLEAFGEHFDEKGLLMLRLLGRELKSSRPNVRLQAARLLGEMLGVMTQKKGGGSGVVSGSMEKQDAKIAEFFERLDESADETEREVS